MVETIIVAIPQDTVNDETVRILSWKVASGSRVEEDQLLCEVETSKAVMEIEAPVAGVVVYSAAIGDEVPVGAMICEIAPEEVSLAAAGTVASESGRNNGPAIDARSEMVSQEKIVEADLPPARLSPLAAKLATEFGFDTETFARGSLVRKDDVLRRAGKLPARTTVSASDDAPAARVGAQPENPPVAGVDVEWTELSRRKVFEAKLLSQGAAQVVQSQVTSTVRSPQLRARLEGLWPAAIGVTALVVFEAARLLRKYPEFNALHDRGRIGRYSDVNVGWAIDAGQGLMVPVIPKADEKTANEIAEMMLQQIDRYADGKLSAADFLGGTFTVSDLSADGISYFQPLISKGQSAILGIGGEQKEDGTGALYLTLAFDHQLTEGRKAAHFLRELSGRMEAHGVLETMESRPGASNSECPFCAICQRDREALRAIKAMLVRSEIPAGFVCSVCLAGV